MTTYQISCKIGSTAPAADLGLEIWVDDIQLYNADHVTDAELPLAFDLEEEEGVHELRFVMKNKTVEHTVVDGEGNIINDARIVISNLAFDEIKLGQIFVDRSVYTHNFNGTKAETQEKFYGEMGCNGTVSLGFTIPIYLWLLEHM